MNQPCLVALHVNQSEVLIEMIGENEFIIGPSSSNQAVYLCVIKYDGREWIIRNVNPGRILINGEPLSNGNSASIHCEDVVQLQTGEEYFFRCTNKKIIEQHICHISAANDVTVNIIKTSRNSRTMMINGNEKLILKKSELICSICLNIFRDAMILNCGHTFCGKCIDEWKSEFINIICPCPMCKSDIKDTFKNFAVDSIVANIQCDLSISWGSSSRPNINTKMATVVTSRARASVNFEKPQVGIYCLVKKPSMICGFCEEDFDEPVTCQCGHIFCHKCIKRKRHLCGSNVQPTNIDFIIKSIMEGSMSILDYEESNTDAV